MGVIAVLAVIFYIIVKVGSDASSTISLKKDLRAHSEQFWKDNAEHQKNFAKQYDLGYNPILKMADQLHYSDGSSRYDHKTGTKIAKGQQYDADASKYKIQ